MRGCPFIPMSTLVTVDIKGMSTQTDFEVIEIFDENHPYPVLLGIDRAIDVNGVINLKKWKMIFEKKSLHIVVLLEPAKGACYIEPMRDDESDEELEYVYKITVRD